LLNSFDFDPSLPTFAHVKVRKVTLRKSQSPWRREFAVAEAAAFELQRVEQRCEQIRIAVGFDRVHLLRSSLDAWGPEPKSPASRWPMRYQDDRTKEKGFRK
jgi:hypothetical protein